MKKTKSQLNAFHVWKKSLDIADIKFDENNYWENAHLIIRKCTTKYSRKFYEERYSFLFDDDVIQKIYEENVKQINANRINPYDPYEVSNREMISFDEAIVLVEERKQKTSGSLETFISRYGDEEGHKRYREFANKCANTLEKYISIHGTENGKNEYEKYLETKSSSLEMQIERYGEEEGVKKYHEMIDKRKYSYSLEGHIEKYGDQGIGIYEDVKQKKSKGNTLEGQIKIHGEVEGKRRYQLSVLKKSRNSSLIGFIENYGEDEGKKRFELKRIKCSPIYQELRKIYPEETAMKLYLSGKSKKFDKAKEKVRNNMQSIYFRSKSKGQVSNQSKTLFDKVSEILNVSLEYGNKKSEIKIFDDENICFYFYDCYHRKSNTIIEYHGVAFHPKEGDYEWTSPYGASYNEIRDRDLRKKNVAIKKGFNFIEIWSDENLHEVIEKIERLINENKDSKK